MDNKNLPKRKDLRLKHYDYSSAGAYFVTICTKDRKNIFWNKISSNFVGQMKRSVSKKVGEPIWQRSFHDHVIRDKRDFETRQKYIYENPIKWYYDNICEDE